MIAVNINNQPSRYKGAENWNELNAKALLRVAKIIFSGAKEDIAKPMFVYAVFGFGNWFFYKLARFFGTGFIQSEIANKLLPEVEWITAKNTLTKQIIDKVSVREVVWDETFYGPSSGFENLKMNEFCDAEFCMTEYQNTKEEIWLWRMMATLYRKGDKCLIVNEGDARYKYNQNQNEERVRVLKKLPIEYAYAVYLWYNGCRAKLVEEYGFLFAARTEQQQEEPATLENNAGQWVDLMHSLGGAELGNIDEVGERKVRQIFFELRRRHDAFEEMKAKNPDLYK
jgi:hypothetical protein